MRTWGSFRREAGHKRADADYSSYLRLEAAVAEQRMHDEEKLSGSKSLASALLPMCETHFMDDCVVKLACNLMHIASFALVQA